MLLEDTRISQCMKLTHCWKTGLGMFNCRIPFSVPLSWLSLGLWAGINQRWRFDPKPSKSLKPSWWRIIGHHKWRIAGSTEVLIEALQRSRLGSKSKAICSLPENRTGRALNLWHQARHQCKTVCWT